MKLTGLVPSSIAPPSERLEAGGKTGPNPTDRAKPGSKHHVITDANGIPLASILTGANRHDVTQLMALVEAIPSVRGKRGRPRRRPDQVLGDRGYDSEPHRKQLRSVRIKALTSLCQELWKHPSRITVI